MPYQVFAYFLFAVLASIYNLWLADRLRKNFNAPYLNSLLYFLIAFNMLNFFNWIGIKIIKVFISGDNAPEISNVWLAYGFIGVFTFPAYLIMLFYYLSLFIELFEKRIPPWLNRLLILAMALPMLIYYKAAWIAFQTNPQRSEMMALPFDLIAINLLVFIPSVFLCINLFQKDDFKRHRNMAFILAFQIIMAVLYFTPLSWLHFTWKNVQVDLLAILFFILPLIPLWIAKKNHLQYIRLYPPFSESILDLQQLRQDFGISPRECELLEMVIKGKSRREIEDALFISYKTVKAHLYNAYRKLGIKNRVQLLNLLHNLQKKPQ